MTRLWLEYPNVTVAIAAPDSVTPLLREHFAPVLAPPSAAASCVFEIAVGADGPSLSQAGEARRVFANTLELVFFLEEEIERAVLGRLGPRVGLHAGAAVLGDAALAVVGHPDTGKTTTTFQLVELGLDLLCEEVTVVDPDTAEAFPFPHTLSLSRA